jgi:uncharacterized protein (DUF2267 family)
VSFDTTVQKTNEWLVEIETRLSCERQDAYRALRSGLHTLRDQMPVDVSAHLAAQLPMLVRGLYFEGWQPAKVPARIRSRAELVDELRRELTPTLEGRAEQILEATLLVLERHLSPGEVDKIRRIVPTPIRELWPRSSN